MEMPDETNTIRTMLVVNERLLSDAVAESQGVTLEAFAYSLSLFMINAVSTQNSAAQIANAAMVSTCTELLKAAATV
jgi:hypothetical protein